MRYSPGMKINLSYKLPLVITKQGKRFVAYTPALDISTSGKSVKDAQKKFNELAELFFEEIIDEGTVSEVLTELGWQKEKKQWQPPRVVSSTSVGVRVPQFA